MYRNVNNQAISSGSETFLADESGAVAVILVLVGLIMLGVAALVVDLGHLYVVRGELQKAAEAGAFAGARALALPPNSLPFPNWDNAVNTATATVRGNSADGALLSDFNSSNVDLQAVQAGYWNRTWTMGMVPDNLNGYLYPASYVPADPINEVPAVKVRINKTKDSLNPITTFFATAMGFDTMDIKTSAVAILHRSGPTVVRPNKCFPLATPESFVKQYWNNESPYTFRIYSDYRSPNGGQWTSFLVNSNSDAYLLGLIDNGNPDTIRIGDQIYIQPGAKANLYTESATKIGQTVLVPVVADDYHTNASTPIKAFAAFHISDAQGGADQYIEGYFVRNYTVPSGIIDGGPFLGAGVMRSKHVQ